jgi:hypothetical protein
MDLTRRTLIRGTATGVAALAIGGRGASAAASATDEIREHALRYFGGEGFALSPPLGMIIDSAFNGGLRYDESRQMPPETPTMIVQSAARIDDIAERERPGVLAVFTIFAIIQPGPAKPGMLISHIMNFLVHERKLDPERMLFVSTERFRPLIGELDDVTAERVLERTFEEARAAGDGSGFFAPAGHPYAPALATVGIYYRMPGTAMGGDLSYPPEGYVEIAEVGIAPLGDSPDGPQIGGFGVERVAMAEGETIPDFGETQLNLLRIIEDEAARTGKDLPPGYTMFASL